MAQTILPSGVHGFNERSLASSLQTNSQQSQPTQLADGSQSVDKTGNQTPEIADRYEPGGVPQLPAALAQGHFELEPGGTYRMAQRSAQTSISLSMQQTQIEMAAVEGDRSTLASLSELNISISVEASFEESLIEIGRTRPGNPVANFNAASQMAVNQFAARQIRGTINFNLSFSQSQLSFNSLGEMNSGLSDLIADGSLGGFVELLEKLFGDDEEFGKFMTRLSQFMNSMQGGPAAAAGPAPSASPAEPAGNVQYSSQSLSVSMEVSMESTTMQISAGEQPAEDPIVLDLNGNGQIDLTSAEDGVSFDMNGNGKPQQTAWVSEGDALLAIDQNGNGQIDNGKELFGDQHGAAHGFAELSTYDSNQDGKIDRQDAVFDQLRAWVDRNRDGISQYGELRSLSQVGIKEISLGYRDVNQRASGNNKITQTASFLRNNGTRGLVADALLNQIA